MEYTKSAKSTTTLLLISFFAIVSILFKAYNYENTKGSHLEIVNEISWNTRHTIDGIIQVDSYIRSVCKLPELESLIVKYLVPNILISARSRYFGICSTPLLTKGKSRKYQSEFYQSFDNVAAAMDIFHICTHFNYPSKRLKRQNSTSSLGNTTGPDSGGTNYTTTEVPTDNTNGTTTSDSGESGWPTWVWIVIAVAAILIVIAIIISIIVCVNMNKSPDEKPPSTAESAESPSGSESESEDEGERRLHRTRRQIATCSYCPQTLQRYGNDRPSCGRNCCETELYEHRNISSTSQS